MGDEQGTVRRARWRRPMCWVAVAVMVGISAHPVLPAWPGAWIASAILLAAGGWVLNRREWLFCGMLLAAAALLGLGSAQLQAYRYPADHIGRYASDESALVQLELRIDQPPRVLSGAKTVRPMPPRQVMQATVRRILTGDGWKDCSGEVVFSCSEPKPELAAGQVVRVLGNLGRPAGADNPGQFDWGEYYRRERILASVNVSHARQITILSDAGPSLLTTLRQRVRSLLSMGFERDRALDHALLRALMLGDSDPQLRDVQQQFIRTGTSHHLAISGMHIAVLGGFVLGLCRLLCLSKPKSVLVVLAFVLLYGIVALPSPPVWRSVLMCLAFGVGIMLRREADALQMLAVSVLGLLAVQPLDLYGPGFQLSFGTVLGLIVLTRPVLKLTERVDPDDQAWGIHRSKWQRFWRWVGRWLTTAIVAGLVAWAVSAPLVAMHFARANPWVIPASLLLAPVVFVALLGGLAKVVATLLLPGLAGWWASLAAGPVWLMRYMVDLLEKLPGSDLPTPPLPAWAVIVYYALLTLPLWIKTPPVPVLLNSLRQRNLRISTWILRLGPAVCCIAIAGLPFWSALGGAHNGELRLTVLSVGAGSCAAVELPDGRMMLADAGSASIADLDRICLDPFLRDRMIRRVDAVAISHHDSDHISAVAELVEERGATILCAANFPRLARSSDVAREMLLTLQLAGRSPQLWRMGDSRDMGAGVTMDVLWPPDGRRLGDNDSSMVFRLRFGGKSILFTGDIQEEAMRGLLASGVDLRADVLIAPHHGSAEASTPAFIAAVRPQVVISSNDRTLTRKQILFEVACQGMKLYRTHTSGAVTVTIRPNQVMQVEPFRGQK